MVIQRIKEWFSGKLAQVVPPKKTAEKERVAAEQLPKWLKEKTRPLIDEAKIEFTNVQRKVNDTLIRARELLDALAKAELHNPKIDPHLIQVMEGNREVYVRRMRIFFEKIRVEDLEYESISSYLASVDTELETLTKQTAKPYYVLQEFFRNESREVALQVKQLEQLRKEMGNLLSNSTRTQVEDAKNAVSEFLHKLQLEQDIRTMEQDYAEQKAKAAEQLKSIYGQMEAIVQSDEHQEFKDFTQKLDALSKEFSVLNQEVLETFSPLLPAFKKYNYAGHEDRLVAQYLEDTAPALFDDTDLKILPVLGKVKEMILSGALTLKDKKQEKALLASESITAVQLRAFQEKHQELERQKRELTKNISKYKGMREYDELHYKKEHVETKLKRLEQQLAEFAQSKEKLDLQTKKQYLEHMLTKITGVDVEVLFSAAAVDIEISGEQITKTA
ncbi:hypothetical protein HZB01_02000 [Candidatus Woesearchaeota archaeon]|nr:hypothetical protein [Candidatus Woesearchaeota archaeon]